MASPTLSVVTPSYNQVDYIEDCLRSVRDQEYDDIEHIVVDGGSTDGTVEMLERYEDDYDLRWVSERDSGQSNAINKGIRMAKGNWIGWQNSDDFYLQGAFKMFEDAKCDNPEVDLIYGDVVVVDESGEKLRQLYQTYPSKFAHRYWSLFARNQAAFFSREVFDTVGYLNEDLVYTMDEDLFWRVLNADLRLTNIPKPFGALRIQARSKTQQREADAWSDERQKIYEQTFMDSILPRRVLEYFAKTVKLIHLIRDRRLSVFR